ncbi:hypothetical protein M422DRAFT_775764 [Sphaerobolus stellatus SS14]|nr:hypothetical protein M422DRAFT_775764 [Sphaerobolus stellatus SS14]
MDAAVAGPSNVVLDVEQHIDEIQKPTLKDRVISSGDTVLFRLLSGDTRSLGVKAKQDINFGKFGKFNANALIGQPYGLTYEIVGKALNIIPPKPIEELEETDATNELINDGQVVQPLTADEIEVLKQQNLPANAIIQAQIEKHSNYKLKTEYSKDKYRKRKEAKFSKSFTTLEPTLYHVNEYWFAKDPSRIRELRSDALAQMLHLGNVHSGGRYLVVDDGGGILVAGILERLAGEGRVLVLNNAESPPTFFVLDNMNFPPSHLEVLATMNWAYTDPDWGVEYHPDDETEEKNDKQKTRMEKRKQTLDQLTALREEFFQGDWDGLLISSEFEPYSIIEMLEPLLTGSANIIVHHPHVHVLAELQVKLRQRPQYLAPNLTEIWTRRYQVLPGRTHPLMNMSGSAGYLLHAIKIYDNPKAIAVENERKVARLAKRRRNMMAEGVTTTTTTTTTTG